MEPASCSGARLLVPTMTHPASSRWSTWLGLGLGWPTSPRTIEASAMSVTWTSSRQSTPAHVGSAAASSARADAARIVSRSLRRACTSSPSSPSSSSPSASPPPPPPASAPA
eukprot:scaffold12080_cov67-Phaeocystis_antarctica.AAC.1